MKIQILDKTKKKKIIECVDAFGINKIPELLIKTGIERVRAFSGNLSSEELMSLWRVLPVEGVGLYVAKESVDKSGVREVRLSVDGIHLWKEQIKNNIIQLNVEQEKEWFKGRNIELNEEQKDFLNFKGLVVVRSFDGMDFIGMGKIGGGVLYGYLPKERRRKSSEI
jgi:NOL1/NOP2/fmu family ribosome biogenesis protein